MDDYSNEGTPTNPSEMRADTGHDDQLKNMGWSDGALQVRAHLIEILQGWQASGNPDLPSAADLEPLVRLAATDTPAADDAATLLALLDVSHLLVTGPR
jgi:hypothetical protein